MVEQERWAGARALLVCLLVAGCGGGGEDEDAGGADLVDDGGGVPDGGGADPPDGGGDPGPPDPTGDPDPPSPPGPPPAKTESPPPELDELVHTGAYAQGTTSVTKVGSEWRLRFEGDETIEYRIDVASAAVQSGLVRVYEASSDSWPLWEAGPSFRPLDAVHRLPGWLADYATLDGESATADTVVLEYTDAVEGLHRRRHTFELRGKTLRVRVQSLDTGNLSWLSNYTGFWHGPLAGVEDPRLVQMQGNLAAPLVLFQNGAEHWFAGTHLDLFWSNASNWAMPNPADVTPTPSSIDVAHQTSFHYLRNTAGSLSATVDETVSVVVTQNVADALVRSTRAKSPYRDLLSGRMTLLLGTGTTPWANYSDHLEELESWGVSDLAVYAFDWWKAVPYAGPNWFPAADPAGISDFGTQLADTGELFGVYTYFGPLSTDSPHYDFADLAFDPSGSFKTEFGKPAIAETAILVHAEREIGLLHDHYANSMGFADVSTYASPSLGGGGDHVDQRAGSGHAATLRDAILDRKRWMLAMQRGAHGPLLGEGSIASFNSNMEYLWAGYVDSVQRTVNTGSGSEPSLLAAGHPLAPTNWPVIPEMEWRVYAPLQVNHGNGFYDRLLGPSDGPEIWSSATNSPVFPLTEAAHDRYRVYELTYGHGAFSTTNGDLFGGGNLVWLADIAKEYFLVTPLQELWNASAIESIRYHHAGALRTFEEVLFSTETTLSFLDPRIELAFDTGLHICVNHGASDWFVTHGSRTYRIEEDGWLAWLDETGFLAFSAAVPESGDARIDYVVAPGRWELLDGRGAPCSFGTLTTENGRIVARNDVAGVELEERVTGTLEIVASAPPAISTIFVSPSALDLAPGADVAVRGIAVLTNGALKDVTKELSWVSGDSEVAEVDEGAAVHASRPGSTTIGAELLDGVPVVPAAVTVSGG